MSNSDPDPGGSSTSVAQPSAEASEKAVKILLENHRLMLTLIGFFIAGLFAYAGRGTNVIEVRFLFALGCFVISGVLVCTAVSVAIGQAKKDKYDPYDAAMKIPYLIAMVFLLFGLTFISWMLFDPPNASNVSTVGNRGTITIENDRIVVNEGAQMEVRTEHDPATRRLKTITLLPK